MPLQKRFVSRPGCHFLRQACLKPFPAQTDEDVILPGGSVIIRDRRQNRIVQRRLRGLKTLVFAGLVQLILSDSKSHF